MLLKLKFSNRPKVSNKEGYGSKKSYIDNNNRERLGEFPFIGKIVNPRCNQISNQNGDDQSVGNHVYLAQEIAEQGS